MKLSENFCHDFSLEMNTFASSISLQKNDILARKDLINFLRNKLKNKNYFQEQHQKIYGKLSDM